MLASPLSAAESGMPPGALLQGALHGPDVVNACLTLVREKHFERAALFSLEPTLNFRY
jgi:hypothetical protein